VPGEDGSLPGQSLYLVAAAVDGGGQRMGQHAAAVILATAVQNKSVREPWLGVPKRRLQGWRGAEGFWRWGGGGCVGTAAAVA
jgi:hypothetical protein